MKWFPWFKKQSAIVPPTRTLPYVGPIGELPAEVGYHVWSIFELCSSMHAFLAVGLVDVREYDPAALYPQTHHLVYRNAAGQQLEMEFVGFADSHPPLRRDGVPSVDGYRRVELNDLLPLN